MTTETAQPAAVEQGSSRDPYIDNARAILITLVVVGHLLRTVSSASSDIIDTWVYAFHMPAFVAISGYLSRSFTHKPRQLGRLLSALLVPYVIFQAIHALLPVIYDGEEFSVELWNPAWTLWFLLALFIWRLATPLLKVLRYPLVFAVAISIAAPLDSDLDTTLTLGRVLSFLPFFVLGLLTRPEHLDKLKRFRHRYLGYIVLAAGFGVAFAIHNKLDMSLFYLSTSYDSDGIGDTYGLISRVALLAAAGALVLAVMLVTPQRHHWWTSIGTNSLTVYLLHAVVMYPLRGTETMDTIDGPIGTGLVILGGVALSILLSREWVCRATNWITNPPIGSWLVSSSDRDKHGGNESDSSTRPVAAASGGDH